MTERATLIWSSEEGLVRRPTRPESNLPRGICAYCGHHERLTRDHFIPKSAHATHGRRHTKLGGANIVMCCINCNHKKGGLHPTAWLNICPPYGIPLVVTKLREFGLWESEEA